MFQYLPFLNYSADLRHHVLFQQKSAKDQGIQSLPLLRIYARGHFQLGKSRFGELLNTVHNRLDTEQQLKYDVYPISTETLRNIF